MSCQEGSCFVTSHCAFLVGDKRSHRPEGSDPAEVDDSEQCVHVLLDRNVSRAESRGFIDDMNNIILLIVLSVFYQIKLAALASVPKPRARNGNVTCPHRGNESVCFVIHL